MRFHCLQHVDFEGPGTIADWIREQSSTLSFTHLYRNDPLPSAEDFDALVIMGGPMSIHDEKEFPWLIKEKELIASAIGQGKKVLGICLGAQLIAAVAGARVYPNPDKEIGFLPVHWTPAARKILRRGEGGNWPATSLLFHWHGETFDLPEGALHLAATEACPHQAFLLGDSVLALQFHPEGSPAILREMVHHEGHELVPAPFIQSAAEILEQAPLLAEGNGLMRAMLERLVSGEVSGQW